MGMKKEEEEKYSLKKMAMLMILLFLFCLGVYGTYWITSLLFEKIANNNKNQNKSLINTLGFSCTCNPIDSRNFKYEGDYVLIKNSNYTG